MSNIQPQQPAPTQQHLAVQQTPTGQQLAPAVPMQFQFDGGAGSYLMVGIGAFLVTVFTLGLAYPWAVSMRCRWQAEHTIVNGQRLKFTGSGASLFGHYIKWWFLTIITLGIYSFWLVPRMVKWTVERQQGSFVLPAPAQY